MILGILMTGWLLSALASPANASAASPAQAQAPASGKMEPISARSESKTNENDSADTDHFELRKPDLKALVIINKLLDPFQLEAQGEQYMSLRDTLKTAIDRNLDIGMARAQESTRKWHFASSCGNFLPNVVAQYDFFYLKGRVPVRFIQSIDSIRFDNPIQIMNAGFKYFGYRGGSVLFGALRDRNNYRAARHKKSATISDALLESSKRYYDLVLAEALLQIRISAVKTSEAQLTLNSDLEEGGLATHLDVLQARTQLSSDRQSLIDQQINRRTAAIDLADLLNISQAIDLTPQERVLRPIRLIERNTPITKLLKAAIERRPELRQFEELRLAAKKAIVVAGAPLQPDFHFGGNILGVGEKSVSALYVINFGINWNIPGLGTVDLANLQAARFQAREALLQSQKELNTVINEVRKSYLKTLSTERKLDETMAKVQSSREELRIAQLRFQYGVGRNIDILRAQQDVTSALIENAQAMADFNVAQIQLLHDCGLLTVDAATSTRPLVIN